MAAAILDSGAALRLPLHIGYICTNARVAEMVRHEESFGLARSSTNLFIFGARGGLLCWATGKTGGHLARRLASHRRREEASW